MKTFKPLLIGFLLGIVVLVIMAAAPDTSQFNANQFTANNTVVQIKSGAALTNITVATGITGIGGAAGAWTLNIGTGLGGLTNYGGGYFQSNGVAGSMPITYLGTNGGGIFNGQVLAKNGISAPGAGLGSEVYGDQAAGAGISSVSLGQLASASANGATALGHAAQATAASATALGINASATAASSMALGNSVTSSVANQIVIGTTAETTLFPGNVMLKGPTNHLTGDLGVGGLVTGIFTNVNGGAITGTISATLIGNVPSSNESTNIPVAGYSLLTDGTSSYWADKRYRTLGITIDGGGSAITSGTKALPLEVANGCTIVEATLICDVSDTFAVEVWRTNHNSTSVGNISRAGAIGTGVVSSAKANIDTTLSGWTTTLASGDFLQFNATSNAASATKATLILKVQ